MKRLVPLLLFPACEDGDKGGLGSAGSISGSTQGSTEATGSETDTAEEPGEGDGEAEEDEGEEDEACDSAEGAEVSPGLSEHFQDWLADSAYKEHDFLRSDISTGSFGGMTGDSDCATRHPVVFVHGNGDRALGGPYGGWEEPLAYFQAQGHRQAELYATTYGPADPSQTAFYHHSEEYVMHTRAFIEAVLEYTGAGKVDVIAHSMGVTMARKAIKGGAAEDPDEGGYAVGDSLREHVDTFVAIAGANLGTPVCTAPVTPVCNEVSGFYPGYIGTSGEIEERSAFLADLASSSGYEATYRYSIWSHGDEVVTGCSVLFQNTCTLPGQTAEKEYFPPYSHFGVRDQTAEVQYAMVVEHVAD